MPLLPCLAAWQAIKPPPASHCHFDACRTLSERQHQWRITPSPAMFYSWPAKTQLCIALTSQLLLGESLESPIMLLSTSLMYEDCLCWSFLLQVSDTVWPAVAPQGVLTGSPLFICPGQCIAATGRNHLSAEPWLGGDNCLGRLNCGAGPLRLGFRASLQVATLRLALLP